MKRKPGFTIVEIVVAMVLLAIAGVLLATTVRTAGLVRLQAQSWQDADEALGQTLADAAAKESAASKKTVRLTGGGKTLTADGVTDSDIGAVWVEVPALEDSLFQPSEAQVQDPPGVVAPKNLTPPEAAPTETEQKTILMDAGYFNATSGFTQHEALTDGVYQGQTGALTAVGVNSVSQTCAASWLGPVTISGGSALVLGEEVLVLSGDITATSRADEAAVSSLWLLPQSGHGQAALVYVAKEGGVNITWNYTDADGNAGSYSVNIPKGWYEVQPTAEEQEAGIAGVDLIGLTKYGSGDQALAQEWQNRLREWSLDETAMRETAQKQKAADPEAYPDDVETMVRARLDRVWARLVLAGVYKGLYN